MCPNCGYAVDRLHNAEKHPVTVHNCPRCGHKLDKPFTIPGTLPESEDNPVRERKTLLD